MRHYRFGLGLVARAVYILWALVCLGLGWLAVEGYEVFEPSGAAAPDEIKRFFFWLFIGGLAVFYALMWSFSAVTESDPFREFFRLGRGGSARWGGVLAYWKHSWKRIKWWPRGNKAPVFLGRTMHKYDPWPFCRKIGVDDENHLVTIAQSRSGKSTTVIWPNLVKYPYPDSVFVLDPKGEHAIMTSRHRAGRGQRIYVLDPFNVTGGKVKTHFFNPLAEIDPDSPRAKEDIGEIADACMITAATSINEAGEHFRGLATVMIMGFIAHVLTTQPKEKHTLPEVYKYFMALRKKEDFERFLSEMDKNEACGNAPHEAAGAYFGAHEKSRGDIFHTMMNALKWISSKGMREHLSRSDFKLEELRTHQASIYVVLDFKAMDPEKQGRYMRVLFNLALHKSYVTPLPADRKRAGRRTLFILDEVAQLGTMPNIQKAYRSHAGADVKLWCFFQEWEALTSTFSNPSAVIGNSTKQFFGCTDPDTAEVIESYLGKYLHERAAGTGEGSGTYESQKSLLDANEIMEVLGQKDPAQIVISGEKTKYKMELKRKTFDPWRIVRDLNNGAFAHWPTPIRAAGFLVPLAVVFVVLRENDMAGWAYILAFVVVLYGWAPFFQRGNPLKMNDAVAPKARRRLSVFSMIMDRIDMAFGFKTARWYKYMRSRNWKGAAPPGRWFGHTYTLEIIDGMRAKDPRRREMLGWYWEWKSDCYKMDREEREDGLVSFGRVSSAEPEMSMEAYDFMLALKDRLEREGVRVRAGFLDDESRIYTPERAAAIQERLRAEPVAQPKAQERPAEPELEEGVKRRAEDFQQEYAEFRYKPKVEAARKRWSLKIGFTQPQVHERAKVMYAGAAANEVDQVTEEYDILLDAAA